MKKRKLGRNLGKFYTNKNVYETALDRIRFIYDEFEEVAVWFSGGKDSTTILNLAIQVAKEKNRLPVPVLFLDQEAEWTFTYEYMKRIMYSDEVKPYWYQIPFKEFNATSKYEEWLVCWEESKKDLWIRPKEEIAIKENNYGTDRFKDLFDAIAAKDFPKKTAFIGGVRAEESPVRNLAITTAPFYKWITWGKKYKKTNNVVFYPIYDWSYTDIWKYINDNELDYNKLYDFQYRYGLGVNQMRVSNLNHETAVKSLFYLQEVDIELYDRFVERLGGIDTAGKMGVFNYFIKDLPFMFKDWKEYRDYLLKHLIKKDRQEAFRKQFKNQDWEFEELPNYKNILRAHINIILTNDWEGARLHNLEVANSTKETRLNAREKRQNARPK